MACVPAQVESYLLTMSMIISGQLGISVSKCDFTIKRVPWDTEDHILAVELSNQLAIPLRVRIYYTGYSSVMDIGTLVLTQDPGYAPGPTDELYVTHGTIDQATYRSIMGYFKDGVDADDWTTYNLILAGSDPDSGIIVSDAGEAIIF